MMNERVEEFTFTWKIENFSSCNKIIGKCLASPTFLVNSFNKSKWHLWFYPKGNSTDCKNYTSLFLHNVELNIENIPLYFKLELNRMDGRILKTLVVDKHIFRNDDIWGFYEFLSIEELNKKITSSEDTLTISCYMKILENNHPTRCEALTKILVDRLQMQWNVSFSNSSSWTERKIFSVSESSSIDVVLTNPKDDILITIQRESEKIFLPEVVSCKITLLSSKGIEYDSKKDSHFFSAKEDVWRFPSFIRKSVLCANKNTLFKDGVFTLLFEFSCSNGRYVDEILEYGIGDIKDRKISSKDKPHSLEFDSLCGDFVNLYNSKKHSDVELKVGNIVFPAHKTVLVARSEVFFTMFDQEMRETQNGVVEIEDIDEETLKCFLSFLYTDKVDDLNSEIALKLLMAAHKYQVSILQEKCAEFLMDVLSNANVCEVLVAADMIGHKELKSFAISYIKNHSKQITFTSAWCQWVVHNLKLATEVFAVLSNDS